ncbi:hypothetical protein SAMN05421678_102498 [Actinopolymorpha cephalotaxi]|uniref:Uncharacterized protein n=1 Tax=Actinopolymorpha cephalotaxi TaxID=504797 RepID=A0A1I2MED9_9ACTN|nr:hypothetical protein SAMN05421678_102498 [Actinopolymorpha cephalotaxi]
MTYRVELHVAALAQMKGLPTEALDALVSRTVELLDKPWDARTLYQDQPEFRQTTFGDAGIMYFKVDEGAELLTIFNVTWVG